MIGLCFPEVWDGYWDIVCEVMNIRSIALPFFFKVLLHISKYLTSGFKLQMFLCRVQGDAQLLPTTLKPSQVSHCAELCELILKSFNPGNCMGVVRKKKEWEGVHSEFEETFPPVLPGVCLHIWWLCTFCSCMVWSTAANNHGRQWKAMENKTFIS